MVKTIIYGLLVFLPIAVIAELTHADPLLIFVVSALAIIPLAKFIGEATEELAIYTGPKFGGLLNATLGNAAELIITVFAIRAGLLDLVRASITGSILGNLLLVLGLSLLVGGLKNGVQVFDRRTASINATLVILAVVALMIPSLFDAAIQENKAAELGLSEAVAVVMIILYGLSVFYTFQQSKNSSHVPVVHESEEKQEEEVHHTPKWSVRFSLGVLAAATLGIVFMSEFLVGAVQHVTEEIGLTEFFIGIIVIPMVGNVAEHLVAVQVAYKNKMELSLAISLGSSLQIALFVAPALVFISVLMGNPLLLVFNEFELIALIGASIIAAFIAQDAESNWLEGAMLLGVFFMFGFAFYFLPAGV
jgi:Ca2+:H+ antiporter